MSYVSKNLGRYNFASNEKQWQVSVRLPDGKWIGETWDADDEPDVGDYTPPSEIVELIAARLERYLMHSGREEKRKAIAYARSVSAEMDRAWAQRRIDGAKRLIEQMEAFIADLEGQEAA
jgi:hypothetical protein